MGATAAKKAFCGTSIIQGFPTPPSPAEGSSIIDALQLWGGGHTTQLGTRLATHTAPPALCPRVLPPPPPHPGHLTGGGALPNALPAAIASAVGTRGVCTRVWQSLGDTRGYLGGGGSLRVITRGEHTLRDTQSTQLPRVHAAPLHTCAHGSVTYVCVRLRYIRVRACASVSAVMGTELLRGSGGGGAELGGLGVR